MIAIAGGKGGCGKTTTTLGLGAALVGQRRRPLAVDLDCDLPNLHLRAGVEADPGLAAVAAGREPDDVAQRSPIVSGLSVLPVGRDAAPRRALRRLPRDRHVLLDTPAGASAAAVRPLEVATAVVVVTTTAPETVEDALKTAAMARAVDTPVAGVVVNRASRVPAALADAFDAPCVAVPAVDDPLTDARASAAYARLAAETLPHAPPTTAGSRP